MTRTALLLTALVLAACGKAGVPASDPTRTASPAGSDRPTATAGLANCGTGIGMSVLAGGHIPLYPKSTITAVYCQPAQDGAGDVNRGPLVVTFVSPAAPHVVRDWIRVTAIKAGHPIPDDGMRFTGKYADGAPFHIVIAPYGAGRSSGTVDIAGLPVG